MRQELQKREGRRKRFRATIDRCGTKYGWRGESLPTVLVTNVYDIEDDELVADHVWLNRTKSMDGIIFRKGEIIEFDARVGTYVKGYLGHDFMKRLENPPMLDYQLTRPTKFVRVGHEEDAQEAGPSQQASMAR